MIARACPKREPSEIGHLSMYHPILSRPAYIGDEMGTSCLHLHKDAEAFVLGTF